MHIYATIILVVSAAGLLGFSAALLLLWKADLVKRFSHFLLSFAVGSMLGVVFFDLLPESYLHLDLKLASLLVLGGIIFSFIIEKAVLFQHCHGHIGYDKGCAHDRLKSSVPLVIVGDFIHNFMDGVLIAAAFLVSVPIGIAATIAEIAHEIPQEIGDFSILIAAGMKRSKVLMWNVVSELGSVLGAVLVILVSMQVEGLVMYMLPIAAGAFLYIAMSDLIPELQHESSFAGSVGHVVLLVCGLVLMFSVGTWFGHSHEGHDDHDHGHEIEMHVDHDEHDHDDHYDHDH